MVDGKVIFDYEVTGSAATSVNTGNILNGDVDGIYTIIIRGICGVNDMGFFMQLNGDTGTNCGFLSIRGSNTAVSGAASGTGSAYLRGTNLDGSEDTNTTTFYVGTLYAKQGAVRLMNGLEAYGISGTTVTTVASIGSVYSVTDTNITNITFITAANGMAVGTRIIILKGDAFPVTTPTGGAGAWKLIGTTVLGAPASSVTFSGLDGDTAVLYYLSSQVNASGGSTGNIYIRPNNDATSGNYGYQSLGGASTTVSAARSAALTGIYAGTATSAGYSNLVQSIIFAKSGFIRPSITRIAYSLTGTTVTGIYITGQDWTNTADNITSLVAVASSNNFDTGSQFNLYALYV